MNTLSKTQIMNWQEVKQSWKRLRQMRV